MTMIDSPVTDDTDSGGSPATEPGADAPVHAVVCAACDGQAQAVTAADVAAFLDDHARCRAAVTEFTVEVPGTMVTWTGGVPDEHGIVAEVWNRQANAEGHRRAGRTRIGGNPGDRVLRVVGPVVPAAWRTWDDVVGGYVEREDLADLADPDDTRG
jgi:hypothetical protein